MATLRIDGTRIHLLDRGRGPAVVLLHAFPLSGEMWRPQIDALADRFRVLAPDLPGFGRSPPARGPVSMASFAELSLGLLDAVGVPEAAVVGLSMGGYVALELQALAPQRVRALVLSDTRAHADTADARKAREAIAAAVEDEGSTQPIVERMLPSLLSSAAPAKLRSEVERLAADASTEGAAAALRAMARRRDFTGELGRIGCPTLVMVGLGDALSPPAEMQGLAEAIPGAALERIAGAGHLANLEQPARFNAALGRFLDQLAG